MRSRPGGWQVLTSLVEERGWRCRDEREPEGVTYHVWPAEGFMVNVFDAEEDVVFDIDIRELQGQERLDLLSAFLRALGQAFRSPVALTFEGHDPAETPYLHYDPARDDFVLDREP